MYKDFRGYLDRKREGNIRESMRLKSRNFLVYLFHQNTRVYGRHGGIQSCLPRGFSLREGLKPRTRRKWFWLKPCSFLSAPQKSKPQSRPFVLTAFTPALLALVNFASVSVQVSSIHLKLIANS
jgi:hypothetical protein